MGKRSREKKERRERGEIVDKKEKPIFGLKMWGKRIIFLGTLLIAFTPLILSSKFFFPFVGPKSLYFMGLVEIIFFTWIFLLIFYPEYRPRLNPILAALAIFLVVLILAAIFGVDPMYSFWSKFERMTGILMMLHLLAFFLVTSSVFKEKDWIKIFLVSTFVGIILSFIALTSKEASMRGGATIGNDSFLGTYLIFDLFLALYLIFKTRDWLRIYASIAFLIMATELFLSGARAAKLSFLAGLVLIFFFWLAFYQKKRRWRLAGISFLVLFLIGGILFTVFAFQPNSFVRKGIVERILGETFGGRFIVWQEAWKSFLAKPWLGWGPENFEFAFDKNYNPCFGTERCGGDVWYDRAHNIVFDTLVASGILGMISYLTIFGAAFWILWKKFSKRIIGFWALTIFMVLFVSYFIQNLTVFDMVSSYMIFFLVLGYVSSIGSEKLAVQSLTNLPGNTSNNANFVPQLTKSPVSASNGVKNLTIGALLILLIFSLYYFVIQPTKSDFYIIKTLGAATPKERIALAEKSIYSSPVGRYQVTEQLAGNTLDFIGTEAAKNVTVEDYKVELDYMAGELQKNIKENPQNLRAYYKLAQLYNTYSQIDPAKLSQAEAIGKEALTLNPKKQEGYWQLAQTKLYQKNYNEALDLTEKALALERNLSRSYIVVVQVAKIAGNNDLAKKVAEEAIKMDASLESSMKEILGR